MNTYITSYLNTRIHYKDSMWINSTMFLGRGLMIPFEGYLNKKLGPRKTCLLGALVFSGSIALASYTIHCELLAVTLTYGLFSGFGIGLIFSPSLFTKLKAYGQTFIVGDDFLSTVTALAGLSAFLASLFWGYFVDRFGYRVKPCYITKVFTYQNSVFSNMRETSNIDQTLSKDTDSLFVKESPKH
ncbi:monocarboxylate transporter 3-like [Tachypleus tridentatus]|uniref:monocarboxylate transporter 3-like n=1 Tax=Tachypleus tridentatus TaxID=6853 RepID=UPI003FD383B8